MAAARVGPLYSRRLSSRVETHDNVWVCWRCDGLEDVSRACDLSVGGLFLSTPSPRPLGARARVDFRKSTLALAPRGRGLGVERNKPPTLRSHARETSSSPSHRQQTQTLSCVSTRELSLLE